MKTICIFSNFPWLLIGHSIPNVTLCEWYRALEMIRSVEVHRATGGKAHKPQL